MSLLVSTLAAFLQIYMVLIFIRVLLTWFQTADWAVSILTFLSPITDPYLNLFRSLIPPLGGIDFSPWLAIIILQVVQGILSQASGQIASAMLTGY
jgi:YggT family protein